MGLGPWPPYNYISTYNKWMQFTPTVPQEYLNAISPQQAIKQLFCELHKLICYSDNLADNINADHEIIQALEDAFDRFVDGEFDQYYKDAIANWIASNLKDIIENAIKMVFFGLTDDGYFCAYVPDTWNEIRFDTGMVFGRSDYGRLILRFEPDADSRGVIDNTYENTFSYNSIPQITQFVRDLEVNTNRTNHAFATLYTNLDEVVSEGDF